MALQYRHHAVARIALHDDLIASGVFGYSGMREDRVSLLIAKVREQGAAPQYLPL